MDGQQNIKKKKKEETTRLLRIVASDMQIIIKAISLSGSSGRFTMTVP